MENEARREYDIEYETAASRTMLENRIPAHANNIKLAIADIDQRRAYEPWRLALAVDFIHAVEHNCEQMLETIGKDRLPATAWIARNLLELLVWIKYCGVSRDNAWRFHEDALRDMRGLMEAHDRTCAAMSIQDESSAIWPDRLREAASEKLGLPDIDSKYLSVLEASKSPGVDFADRFQPSHKWLSKFAHPTAGLVHGISHQVEGCRELQAVCTTQGVYYAAQSTLALGAQFGIPAPQ